MGNSASLSPSARRVVDAAAHLPSPDYSAMSEAESLSLIHSMRASVYGEPAPDELRSLVEIEEWQLPDYSADLTVRQFVARAPARHVRPCVVFLHGGGFVTGNRGSNDRFCIDIAVATGAVVVSVEYRLAPEHPHPAGTNDAWAVVQYCQANAAALGIDATKVAIAGTSAGATLAANVALLSRDSGGPPLVLQALIYPVLDPDMKSDSYRRYRSGFVLSADQMRWYWKQNLGHDPIGTNVRDASPMRADSLAGLAPTLVFAAEFDPLHDEAVVYARALSAAANDVELVEVSGQVHGFLVFDPNGEDASAVAHKVAASLIRNWT